MTCIVAMKTETGFLMGADSIATNMETFNLVKHPKIFKVGDFIIGYTLSFRFGKLLQHSLFPPEHSKEFYDDDYMNSLFSVEIRRCLSEGGYTEIKDNKETGGKALIGYHGKVWFLEDDFSLIEMTNNIIAVGSGDVAVISAIKALKQNTNYTDREIMEKSLEIVEDTIITVKGPFHFLNGYKRGDNNES